MLNPTSRNEMRKRRHARVRNKVIGTSEMPRLCVFRSNKHIEAQVIDDTRGITLASASSTSLKLDNGSNVAAAETVGDALAKACLAKGIKKVVFDRGGYLYHGRVQALAEACRKAGLTL